MGKYVSFQIIFCYPKINLETGIGSKILSVNTRKYRDKTELKGFTIRQNTISF